MKTDTLRWHARVRLACSVLLLSGLPRAVWADWGSGSWGGFAWGEVPAVPTVGWWGLVLLAFWCGLVAPRAVRSRAALVVSLVLLAAPLSVMATQIGVPYLFQNGAVADADEVNANFDALVAESNAQDVRIAALESWDMNIDAAGFALEELGGSTGVAGGSVLFDYSTSTRWDLRGPPTLPTSPAPPFQITWPSEAQFGEFAPVVPVDVHLSTTRLDTTHGRDTIFCIAYNQHNCGGARVDPSFPGSKFQWEHDYAPYADERLWEINWDFITTGGTWVRPLGWNVNMASEDPRASFGFRTRPIAKFPGSLIVNSLALDVDQMPISATLYNEDPGKGTALVLKSQAVSPLDCAGGPGTCGSNLSGLVIAPDFSPSHEVVDYRYISLRAPTGTSLSRASNANVGIDIGNLNQKSGGFAHPIVIADQSAGAGARASNGNIAFLANGLSGNHIQWGQKAGGNWSHLWNDEVTDRPCFWSGRRTFGAADTDSPCASGGWQLATHQHDEVIGVPVWAIASQATTFCDGGSRPPGTFCTSDAQCTGGGTCSKSLDTGDAICEAKGEMQCIANSVLQFGAGTGPLASIDKLDCAASLTDGAMTIVACHQSAALR